MKFLVLLAIAALSVPAFSQTCYVDLVVKNSGRVIRTFTGYGDSSCMEGMKECRKSIRLDYSNNREFPNGSLDCIADRNSHPAPQPQPIPPRPQPQPYPQPQPQPYPQPHPQPYPQPHPQPYPQPVPYRSVEVTSLILDIASVIYSSEPKTKIIESLILQINSYALIPIVQICRPTSSWNENVNCLVNGVQRAPRELIDESTAIYAVGVSCKKTSSWADEKACFSIATRNNRLPSLGYLAPSCEQMYSSESASRCYRSVFGVNQ